MEESNGLLSSNGRAVRMLQHHLGKVLIGCSGGASALADAFANAGYMPVVASRADHVREFAGRDNFDLIVIGADLDSDVTLVPALGHLDAVRVYFGDLNGPLPDELHAVLPRSLAPTELVARTSALLALRVGPRNDGVLRFGPLELDVPRRSARWRGEPRALTPIQFRVLALLVEKQGAVATREELQRAAWRWTPVNDGERLVAHIRRIRAKLEADPSHPRFLLTARGEGFRLADPDRGPRASWSGIDRRRGERRRSAYTRSARDSA